MKGKQFLTAPRIAGYIVILLSAVLSFYTEDSTYWSVGIPSGMSAIITEEAGRKFGKNNNNKNNSHENS